MTQYKKAYWPYSKHLPNKDGTYHLPPEANNFFVFVTESRFKSFIMHIWYHYIKGYGVVKDP